MAKEFDNFSKKSVYYVGYYDSLKVVEKTIKGKGKKEVTKTVSKMIKEAEESHDNETFMLREGFYDF